MQEKTLLQLALLISIVGICALFILSESITVDRTAIDKITLENKGEYVKLQGVVTGIIDTDTLTIITIEEPKQTKAILFKSNTQPTQLREGNQIEILGKVEEYESKPEIIANKVRIIS